MRSRIYDEGKILDVVNQSKRTEELNWLTISNQQSYKVQRKIIIMGINIVDIILHLDVYLISLIELYGSAVYFIIFLVILAETGLVIAPFLPGDSLLFVAGTLASQKSLSVILLFLSLSLAAILGDTLNYWIGNYFGENFFVRKKLIKQENLDKTKEFYRKHGGKTIILARFAPIIRTFAPFVAGVGKMDYKKFLFFNIVGGVCWVGLFLFAGYFFGAIPFVQDNLVIFILIIVAVSFVPPVLEFLRSRKNERKNIRSVSN